MAESCVEVVSNLLVINHYRGVNDPTYGVGAMVKWLKEHPEMEVDHTEHTPGGDLLVFLRETPRQEGPPPPPSWYGERS